MSIMQEFREFAVKGNMIDLAVGVIIGAIVIYYTNWYWVDTIIAVAILGYEVGQLPLCLIERNNLTNFNFT